LDGCIGIADLEAKAFNPDDEIDSYNELIRVWDLGERFREFFNSLLPEDKQLDLANGATLDDWIVASGSTVEYEKQLMMTIACLGENVEPAESVLCYDTFGYEMWCEDYCVHHFLKAPGQLILKSWHCAEE